MTAGTSPRRPGASFEGRGAHLDELSALLPKLLYFFRSTRQALHLCEIGVSRDANDPQGVRKTEPLAARLRPRLVQKEENAREPEAAQDNSHETASRDYLPAQGENLGRERFQGRPRPVVSRPRGRRPFVVHLERVVSTPHGFRLRQTSGCVTDHPPFNARQCQCGLLGTHEKRAALGLCDRLGCSWLK